MCTDASATCNTIPATCPYRKGDLWKVTNALGHVTEYVSYDGAGRVLSVKDANNVVTDNEYHPRGWLTASKVRGADNATESDDAITRIAYNANGQVIGITQPDLDYMLFTYDAAHRLTDVTDAMGNTVHYTLDNAGNRVKEETKDPKGVLTRSMASVYDSLGRLQTSLNAPSANAPNGTAVALLAYDANNNLDTATDALNRVTDQNVDPLNRLKQSIQNVGGVNATTQFEYDARDNLTKVIDPKNLNTVYAYNGLNELTRLTSPDTGITEYAYDSAGNRKTQKDAKNVTSTYSYDALNRLTQVAYPTTSLNSVFTYDTVNTVICATTERFTTGRLTKFTDPSGMKVNYARNNIGQVQQVSITQGTTTKIFANNITYYPFGPLSRIEFLPPNSTNTNPLRVGTAAVAPGGGGNCPPGGCTPVNPVIQTRVYDLDYDIQSVGGLNYVVDNQGNITSITDAAGGNAFEYDTLDRLKRVVKLASTPTDVESYTYDATGNRLSKTAGTIAETYGYPNDSHRLASTASGFTRQYDLNGNTLQSASDKFFTYDERNRLTGFSTTSGAPIHIYQYNAKGERVRKYRDGSSGSGQEYSYDESGKLLRQKRALFEQEIIWLDDMPIGVNQNGTWYGILSDHLNTPRQAFDIAKQQIKWRWDAADNAFGEKAAISSGLTLDLRFPGQIYDAESATHYNYFRTYGPDTGRYNESDPIGLRGGINTYGYAGGNPLMYSDPMGLTYGDGVLEMEDVFFGPTYWMRQQMGLNTSFSR